MTQLTAPQLKELAHRVIVAQGNVFSKELLRANGAKIGATKEDFAANLDAVIDEGLVTQEGVVRLTWHRLSSVGSQHG